jgi:hypothetical protein
MRPPYASPAPKGAGAYAMPLYFLCQGVDISTGNTTLSQPGDATSVRGAKARIAVAPKSVLVNPIWDFNRALFFVPEQVDSGTCRPAMWGSQGYKAIRYIRP